jgi:hypothetical protein
VLHLPRIPVRASVAEHHAPKDLDDSRVLGSRTSFIVALDSALPYSPPVLPRSARTSWPRPYPDLSNLFVATSSWIGEVPIMLWIGLILSMRQSGRQIFLSSSRTTAKAGSASGLFSLMHINLLYLGFCMSWVCSMCLHDRPRTARQPLFGWAFETDSRLGVSAQSSIETAVLAS